MTKGEAQKIALEIYHSPNETDFMVFMLDFPKVKAAYNEIEEDYAILQKEKLEEGIEIAESMASILKEFGVKYIPHAMGGGLYFEGKFVNKTPELKQAILLKFEEKNGFEYELGFEPDYMLSAIKKVFKNQLT